MGESAGPIVSFLPIFVMGVLFGLAMDYEMFLVSAMREEFVQTGDARAAVLQGFRASSRVVTAAALIMTSVFVAFIPGRLVDHQADRARAGRRRRVDAFVVRMTLVPAVMVLMGRHAWWLPRWLDRRAAGGGRRGSGAPPQDRLRGVGGRDRADRACTPASSSLHEPGAPRSTSAAPPGAVTRVDVPDGVDERALGHVLVGRARHVGGELVVAGRLLPEQREEVNRLATLVELGRDQRDEDDGAAARARHGAGGEPASDAPAASTSTAPSALVVELDDAVGPASSTHARPRRSSRPPRPWPRASRSSS